MNDRIRSPVCDYLFKAILTLKTLDECYAFFEDLCTVGEIQSMAQRTAVAKCLYENRTNAETKKLTGAAPATISRVNRSFQYGNDAYRIAIETIEKTDLKEV